MKNIYHYTIFFLFFIVHFSSFCVSRENVVNDEKKAQQLKKLVLWASQKITKKHSIKTKKTDNPFALNVKPNRFQGNSPARLTAEEKKKKFGEEIYDYLNQLPDTEASFDGAKRIEVSRVGRGFMCVCCVRFFGYGEFYRASLHTCNKALATDGVNFPRA